MNFKRAKTTDSSDPHHYCYGKHNTVRKESSWNGLSYLRCDACALTWTLDNRIGLWVPCGDVLVWKRSWNGAWYSALVPENEAEGLERVRF